MRKLLFLFIGLVFWCIAWQSASIKDVLLPQKNEPALFYSNHLHDNLKKVYLTALNSAKKSILLIIYSLSDGDIISSLNQKAEEGISISLVCDAKASYYGTKKLNPKIKIKRLFGKGLMHQKILVIDEEKIWLGSSNLTSESLLMHANLVTAFASPEIAKTILKRAEMMSSKTKTHYLHQTFSLQNQTMELWFLPDDVMASKKIIDLIRSAKKTIQIAMFTFTRHDFADELIKAKNRGVDVKIALDKRAGKGAGLSIYEKLSKDQTHVYLNKSDALLHHKFMLIDDETLINGSANWTKAAFNKNEDCFLIIYNLNNHQKEQLQLLWNNLTKF